MKNQDILTQLFIFIASIITTSYALFSNDKQKEIRRPLLITKLLGSVIVAFFVMPAVMEYFGLSIRMTLLATVIVAYGLEEILKVSVKRIIKSIDKDESNNDN